MKRSETIHEFQFMQLSASGEESLGVRSSSINHVAKFDLVRDIMVVLVTCKYEEDPIKNEGASVFTTLIHYNYGSYPLPWTPEF